MSTLPRTTAKPAPLDWRPCTLQAHLDLVRDRHEDLVGRVDVARREEVEEYLAAASALLDHLAGLHADDCLIRLIVEGA